MTQVKLYITIEVPYAEEYEDDAMVSLEQDVADSVSDFIEERGWNVIDMEVK